MSTIVPRYWRDTQPDDQAIGPDGRIARVGDLWRVFHAGTGPFPVIVPDMNDAIVNVVTGIPGAYPSPPVTAEPPGAVVRQPPELTGRPRGVWVVAGTGDGAYPCRCGADGDTRGCSPMWCPCAGRLDLDNVPLSCCARRFTPDIVAQAAKAYNLSKSTQYNQRRQSNP
jgi:hypothetical protein